MVPAEADDWAEAAKPGATMGDYMTSKFEARLGDREADDVIIRQWTKHGEQMPGVKFYATTGVPGGSKGEGFEFWDMLAGEQDACFPSFENKVQSITIDNQGKTGK